MGADLEHVLDMFSHDDTFHFVIMKIMMQRSRILHLIWRSVRKIRMLTQLNHMIGPSALARPASSVPAGSPIIISYCDFFVDWDYAHFQTVSQDIRVLFQHLAVFIQRLLGIQIMLTCKLMLTGI